MTFLVAIAEDKYRKPSIGMWEYFVRNVNKGAKVDMAKSFYCGDAAGRPKTAT